MNLDYKEKYLKYKNKYLLTKSQQGGNYKLLQLFNSELFKKLNDTDLEKIIKLHYENKDHQKLIISRAKILKIFLIDFKSFFNDLKNPFSETNFIIKIKDFILDITITEELFIEQFNKFSELLKTELLSPLEKKLKEDLFKVFTQRERLKEGESIPDKINKISEDFIDSDLFKRKLSYLVTCYMGKTNEMPVLLQLPMKTINLTEIETGEKLEYGSKIKIINKENGKSEEIIVVEVYNDIEFGFGINVLGINSIYFHLYNLQKQDGHTLKDYFFQKTLSLLFNTTISSEEFINIARAIKIKKEEPIEFFFK